MCAETKVHEKLLGYVSRLLVEAADQEGSKIIKDPEIIRRHVANPEFPYLVSFPRTGSHWLRMLMELYFEMPSLVLAFYYHDKKDYLLLHTHDLELDLVRSNVLYLYRHPVTTIYSQMTYHCEEINSRERIIYWADLYGRHVDKWLCQERFTKRKTIVTYGEMKQDIAAVFRKLSAHFDKPFDEEKLKRGVLQVTKEEVKRKTPHDPRVIQAEASNHDARRQFADTHSSLIWDTVLHERRHLWEELSKEALV